MVLRRMEREGKAIIYVNVTNILEPTALCRAILQAVGADPLPDTQAANLTAYLSYVKERIISDSQATLYLDNWEDLWYAIKESDNQRLEMLQWLAELCSGGLHVLLSSRIIPAEYDITVITCPVAPLEQGTDRTLFQQVYQAKNGRLSLKGEAYEKLLQQLDGHPLTIVLVATQAAGAISWNGILSRWTRCTQISINSRHESLDRALEMSWEGISGYRFLTLGESIYGTRCL